MINRSLAPHRRRVCAVTKSGCVLQSSSFLRRSDTSTSAISKTKAAQIDHHRAKALPNFSV